MRTLHRLAALALAATAVGLVLLPGSPAQAHPLGNFSVNQYSGLILHPDRVEANAVVDIAEIPTLQERPAVDTNGDRTVSDAERMAHAAAACPLLAGAVDVRVGDERLQWTVEAASFDYNAGTGGLAVSRLTCTLAAPAALAGPATLALTNGYLADRVGWREIIARGVGVGLVDPPVPATSVSHELRAYPDDLLASALDVRSVTLQVTAGAGSTPVAAPGVSGGSDPVSRWLSTVDRYVADLAGGPLTPAVTIAAILLAVLLGAGHAALPGHGKTVLAAYLAGRAGRRRDALMVAGTVTLTHTGGVLVLGLVITAGSAVVGERILGWLGVVSGLVVLAVGIGMLRSVLRRRAHSHAHGHDHGHDHGDGHRHDHPHGTDSHHRSRRWGLAGIGIAGGLVPSPSALVVLLAAIGLGRTAFGVLLVVAYGAGMAATLTGAGLLLLAVQRRLTAVTNRTSPDRWVDRLRTLGARLSAATPAATAGLVLVVGAGLALRAATSVI